VGRTALEKITDREQAVTATTEHVRAQIDTLAGQLRDLEAELADLQVARKVILALGDDEPTGPSLPGNPVYQHILTALTDATTPMRAKDLCHALDLGIEHTRIEGMRSKLKRLVATGLVVEDEPGLFTLPRPNPND
jgi:hypothetical protein